MIELKEYNLGLRDTFKFRPNTHDDHIIRAVLIDRSEYGFFVECTNPRVIFDVGANIGCASVLFANAYPNALIFAFEPEPKNFELLKINTQAYKNVKLFNMALGATTESRLLMASDDEKNLGGFSFYSAGANSKKTQRVEVVGVADILEHERIPKIDLIKIDTEGCEFEILNALYNMQMVPQFVMGEGHCNNDWKMYDLLDETHDVQVQKNLFSMCYPFYAQKRKE